MGDGDRLVALAAQRPPHQVGVDRLAPGHRDRVRVPSDAQADLVPALGEGAAGEVQHALGDGREDGALHHQGRAGGGQQDVARGAEDLPQARLETGIEGLERGRAMADHRPVLGRQDLAGDIGGPRDEKTDRFVHRSFAAGNAAGRHCGTPLGHGQSPATAPPRDRERPWQGAGRSATTATSGRGDRAPGRVRRSTSAPIRRTAGRGARSRPPARGAAAAPGLARAPPGSP